MIIGMSVETRPYAERSAHYLRQASAELANGDLLQASEKGWGAAAQVIKAVAEERGWDHSRHALLIRTTRRIVEETGDGDLWQGFAMARELHENFYEGELGENDVVLHLESVTSFIEKMRALIDAA